MDSGRINEIQKKVNTIIHEADPVNLGGAEGEYELQVNEIVKQLVVNKKFFSGSDVYEVFRRGFGNIVQQDESGYDKIAGALNKIK